MAVKTVKLNNDLKVKVYKTPTYWEVKIDPFHKPNQEGFEEFIRIESYKFEFNKFWSGASVCFVQNAYPKNMNKETALKMAEGLILAGQYAFDMDKEHGRD